MEQELVDSNQIVILGPKDEQTEQSEQSSSATATKPAGPDWITYTVVVVVSTEGFLLSSLIGHYVLALVEV